MTSELIDLDLVDKTIALIPEQDWPQVQQVIVTTLVDNMPGFVLEKLTGTSDGFDRAEEILYDYYQLPELANELIVDPNDAPWVIISSTIYESVLLSNEYLYTFPISASPTRYPINGVYATALPNV